MATDNKGTKNLLSSNEKPDGYSDPVVVDFADHEWVSTRTLSVLKATVENATATTTMANIISNGTIGITKQVTDIMTAMGADAVTTSVYTDWIGLTHNLAGINGNAPYLQATAMSYTCTVKIYSKNS